MRKLHECNVHGRFVFDLERLEAQAGSLIASCPRCWLENIQGVIPREPPRPRTTCWYPEGEVLG